MNIYLFQIIGLIVLRSRISIDFGKCMSGIIVLLKTSKVLQYLSSMAVLTDSYTYHIFATLYMSSYIMACKPIKI